jgi:hypothetical protein
VIRTGWLAAKSKVQHVADQSRPRVTTTAFGLAHASVAISRTLIILDYAFTTENSRINKLEI